MWWRVAQQRRPTSSHVFPPTRLAQHTYSRTEVWKQFSEECISLLPSVLQDELQHHCATSAICEEGCDILVPTQSIVSAVQTPSCLCAALHELMVCSWESSVDVPPHHTVWCTDQCRTRIIRFLLLYDVLF